MNSLPKSTYFVKLVFVFLVTKLCTNTFNIQVDTRINDVDIYTGTGIWNVDIIVLVGSIHTSSDGALAPR
jgi:hypothetical protein